MPPAVGACYQERRRAHRAGGFRPGARRRKEERRTRGPPGRSVRRPIVHASSTLEQEFPMRTSATAASVSRRTALTAIGGGGLGLALAAHGQRAAAQEDPPPALAGHPQVGVWMVDSPIGRAIAVYAADGSVVTAL